MKKIYVALIIGICLRLSAQPTGWNYNQPIIVSNSNTVSATDYQLLISLNTQSLIATGKLNSNGSDLRFAGTCTSSAFFNYWIETGLNTPTTQVWVKIPFLAANSTTTIFMFSGNPGATAVSSPYGTFRGPNSSTDSVSGGSTNTVSACQRGFRFSPNVKMLVTHFGKNEPLGTTRYVTLFDFTSQAVIAQTTVSGVSSTYSYNALPNPLWLNAGTQYLLELYNDNNDQYFYMGSSQIGQHLTYYDMRYCNSCTQNTFPTTVLTAIHYGYPDFWYFITNTLSVLPTYTIGSSSFAITGPSVICTGSSATLTTNASGTFSWNTGSSSNTIVVAPTSNTVYNVSQGTSYGCPALAFLILNVNVQPTITIAPSSPTACLGKSISLTASGANSYVWTGGITNGVTFTPNVTSGYTVTGTNACGTAVGSITIPVTPLPISVVASSTNVCQFSAISMTSSGATQYTWSPGVALTTSIISQNPAANTIYSVSASDGTCTGTGSISIQVRPNPTLVISASSSYICPGETVTITVTGAPTYSWAQGLGTNSFIVVSPTTATAFNVTGTNSVNCSANANQVILTKDPAIVNASTNRTVVCVGLSATLTATGNCTNYVWNTGSTTAQAVISPTVTDVYTVTGTYTNNCVNTATVLVNVFQTSVAVSGGTTVCPGTAVVLSAGAATGYTWSTGVTQISNISVTPSTTTVYTLTANTVTLAMNCPSTTTVQVGVFPSATVQASATRTNICKGETTTISATGATTYSWTGAKTNTLALFTFSTNTVNNYTFNLAGTDANGCKDNDKVVVKVSACTGLYENQLAELNVFPNPARGTFFIESNVSMDVVLYSETGQEIRKFSLNGSNQFQVTVSDLARGIYFLRSTNPAKSFDKKVVIE